MGVEEIEVDIGDIALCDKNIIGLITKKTYILERGFKRTIWKGIKLHGNFGEPWQSQSPKYLCNIDEILTNLRLLGSIYKNT